MLLISREEALASGLKRYFTGEPCPHGHICERQVANFHCLECTAEKKRRWRAKNPEESRRRTRAYRDSHPEWDKVQNTEYHRRRRARMRNGSHTSEDIQDILRLQSGKCAICLVKLSDKFERDHIMPLCKGGDNNRSNIQILCSPCNIKKGSSDPVEFMQARGRLL